MPLADQNQINAEESDYLFVTISQILNSGNGLFTAVDIYKEEIIAAFKGVILSAAAASKIRKEGNDKYFMNLPNGSTLDCMNTNCYAKYANDAVGFAKSDYKNNAKITLDDNNNVCLIAIKKIESGDEIFCDYGKKYWKKHL